MRAAGRARRAVARAAAAAGLAAVFVSAAGAALLLHAGTPAARRVLARETERALADAFAGTVVVERLASVTPGGIDGLDALVRAPDGALALRLVDARVVASLPRVLLAFARGGPLELDQVRARSVEVSLAAEPGGEPAIARAFAPRRPAAPGPAAPSAAPLRVRIAAAEIDHAHVAGPTPAGPLDAKLARVHGSVRVDGAEVHVDAERTPVEVKLGMLDPRGVLEAHLDAPAPGGGALAGWASFDGLLGEIDLSVRGSTDGRSIDLSGDLPDTPGALLRAWLPGAPFFGSVGGEWHVRGVPPALDAEAKLRLDDGEVALAGRVDAGAARSADVRASVRDLDLRSLVPDAPSSRLSGSGTASLRLAGAGVEGSFAIDAAPSTLAGLALPPGSARGTIAPREIEASVRLDEPGAPLAGAIVAKLDPHDATAVRVEIDAHGVVPSIQSAPRLAPLGLGGSARWRAKGSLERGRVVADVDATVAGLRRGALAAGSGQVRAHVTGTPERPRVAATANARDVAIGGFRVPVASASAQGDASGGALVLRAEGEGRPSAELRTTVRRSGDRADFMAPTLVVRRGELSVTARAERAHVGADGLRVPALVVEGAGGTVRGTLAVGRGRVDAVTEPILGLDLGHLAAIFGQGHRVRGGHADVTRLEAHLGGAHEQAHVALAFDDVSLPYVERVAGTVQADLDEGALAWAARGEAAEAWAAAEARARGELDEAARAALGDLGAALVQQIGARTTPQPIATLATRGTGRLGGPALAATSWARVTGEGAEVQGALDLDAPVECVHAGGELSCVSASKLLNLALPWVTPSLRELGGKLVVDATLSRPRGDMTLPVVNQLVARTEGLHVGGPGTEAESAWRSAGVDLMLQASLRDGTSDARPLHAELGLRSELAPLGSIAVDAALPLAGFLAHPDLAREQIFELPFDARLAIPPTSLERWPRPLRPRSWLGLVTAVGSWHGSVRDPQIELHATGRSLESTDARLDVPFDVDVATAFARGRGQVTVRADRSSLHRDASGEVHEIAGGIQADVDPDALRRSPSLLAAPWRATARVLVRDLPLASLPVFAESEIAGVLDGEIVAGDLHAAPIVAGVLHTRGLSVAGASFTKGEFTLNATDSGATLAGSLVQPDGAVAVAARGRLAWVDGLVPTIDLDAERSLAIEATRLRAALLQPLLRDVFARVDGRVAGDVTVTALPGERAPHIQGTLAYTEGILQIPELGQELTDVTATVTAEPGHGLRIDGVSARSGAGALRAEGTIELDGFAFAGGTASVEVPEKQPVPLTLEGVSFGDASGRLTLEATREPGSRIVEAEVTIPTMHVALPESSSRALQPLDDDPPDPRIRAGVRRPDGKLVAARLGLGWSPRAADALQVQLGVHLGEDVRLRRGSLFDLRVATPVGDGGAPLFVELSDRARVTGTLDLPGGDIEVLGKRFEIDKGSVRFDGDDAANPDVAATVRWDAPDGTRIYADYFGRLRDAKVVLRSEPARSQPEIMSLVLFGQSGSDDYGVGGAGGSNSAAAGVGGGLAAEGLNRVLSGVAPISARVDTSQAVNPRPEVAVQLGRDVSAQLAYSTGVPPPGQNPDRVLVTLDWSFRRRWSFSTTLGDRGSSLFDLVWQYRY